MKKLIVFMLFILMHFSFSVAQHFTPVGPGNPTNAMNFYFSDITINGVDIEAGDEVGIFDGVYCVSAAVLTGPVSPWLSLTANEDNIESGIDGFTAGHAYSFRIWDAGTTTEISDVSYSMIGGNDLFTISGSFFGSLNGNLPLPDIDASPASLAYGNVNVGATSDLTVTISNAGTGTLNVTSTSITGSGSGSFSIQSGGGTFTLAPGATRNIVVRFSPSVTGAVSANLSIASNDPDENPFTVALSGTGVAPDISASPNPAAFGNVFVGSTSDITVVVSNTGTSDLNITSTTISGTGASRFSIQSGGGTATVTPGSTRNIVVRFSPNAIGAVSASLDIASNDPDENPYNITLTGTGIAPDISVSPTSRNYGNVIVGNSNTESFVVTNTGNTTLNVSSVDLVGGNSSEFVIASGGGSFSLTAGADRTVQVTFAPASVGSKSTTLRFASDDPDENPFDVSLTGAGIPANTAPVVFVPDQTIPEGSVFSTLLLDDYVIDDNTADEDISWSYSGNSQLTVSIISRVATISIPNTNWYGSETIIFYATDDDPGPLTGSDPATFTVTPVNDAPVVSNIPNQGIADGGSFNPINLDNYVQDVETMDEDIIWTHSPATNLNISIVNRVATVSLVSPTWIGSETVTFTATDDDPTDPLSDSDDVTFTVTNDNISPVVSDIPDQTVDEGASFASIALDDYVTDSETADENITWTYSGNTELIVNIDGSRIATVTTPDEDWYGNETITFKATDDDLVVPLSGSDAATFIVNPVNDPPVINGQNPISVPEDQNLTINLSAFDVSDVDNPLANLSVEVLSGTNYTITGSNSILPAQDFNGLLIVNLQVNDLEDSSAPFAANVTVNPVNDAPVVSDIPDQTVNAGESFAAISLNDYASDVETADEDLIWSFSGNDALTVEITDNVATITLPTADWTGIDTITFIVTDDDATSPLTDSDSVIFTVNVLNQAPVVTNIPDQTINEGEAFETIGLDLYVEDDFTADEDIGWDYSGNSELMVTITDRIATVTLPPDEGWYGSEIITFTATDDDSSPLSGSDDVTFTVNDIDGLESLSDATVQIYPNPSSDIVYIIFENNISTDIIVEVIDVLGQVSLTEKKETNKDEVELNVSNLTRGPYMIRIASSTDVYSSALIVE